MGLIIRFTSRPEPQWRRFLERCWPLECDLDHLILRARLLRNQGHHSDAHALEDELQPIF